MSAQLDMPSPPVQSARRASDVIKVIRGLRIVEAGLPESEIHCRVHDALAEAGFVVKREAKIAKGCRADLLVGSIVLEIKRQRPDRARLLTQLSRYAAVEGVTDIIVVSERAVVVPATIHKASIHMLSLQSLWGIAL